MTSWGPTRVPAAMCWWMHLWAKWVPVYEYEFNDQSAPYYFPTLPGFTPLAAHTIDIQFLFQNWHGGVLGVNHPAELTRRRVLVGSSSWRRGPSSRQPVIRTARVTRRGHSTRTAAGAPAVLSEKRRRYRRSPGTVVDQSPL